ncbi:MAG: DNA polymerase Y family protein [Thermoanaerobaculia bacterium]
MAAVACVHVPALPLQLLLARHPEWEERPAAVVDRDSPQGRILWLNGRARRRRILPGMRYAAALALDGDLVAGTVEPREIETAVEELTHRLLTLTPGVEPAAEEPGVFFLDASGLDRLWPSMEAWAEAVAEAAGLSLRARPQATLPLGPRASARPAGRGSRRPGRSPAASEGSSVEYRSVAAAVGFTRFGTYAVARTRRGVTVFPDREAERRAAGRVPLARLGIDPELRDALDRLGVTTVDALRRLPEGGLAERFGAEARRLHRLACDALSEPLTPERPPEPLGSGTDLEQPDGDATRLLFLLKRLLDPLLGELARRGEALASLAFTLRLEDGSCRREALAPARPTRDASQLLELIRLRLESLELPCRVEEVRLEAESTTTEVGQLQLFPVNARRDPEAGARALARLKAELGDSAVVRARLADRWMPEGAFLWEPVAHLEPPTLGDISEPRLVRRILAQPRPLPSPPRHLRNDGWLIRGTGDAVVTRLAGPYTLSGGWWYGGTHRDYYFAETQAPRREAAWSRGGRSGELLWIYLDREQERWFLQGTVA